MSFIGNNACAIRNPKSFAAISEFDLLHFDRQTVVRFIVKVRACICNSFLSHLIVSQLSMLPIYFILFHIHMICVSLVVMFVAHSCVYLLLSRAHRSVMSITTVVSVY